MSDESITHLYDLFAAFGPISARRMFGGHGVYHEGVIIGVVIDDAWYLKADDATRARFAAAGGATLLYTGQHKPITMSYWSLAEEAMRPWAQLAHEAALRKTRAPKKPRKIVPRTARK